MTIEDLLEKLCQQWFGNNGHALAFEHEQARFRLDFLAGGYRARLQQHSVRNKHCFS